MRQHALKAASLNALLEIIDNEPGASRHLFRGQGNANWSLVPGLYRRETVPISGSPKEAFDTFEYMWLKRFFDEGFPYLPQLPRTYSNDRIIAQHFGVPTRLLDWTVDPFVATYFAVERWDDEHDAAIFMLLPDARYRPEDAHSYEKHSAIAFTPPAIDRRIPAQKSVFTFHPYGDPEKSFVPLEKRAKMGNQISDQHGQLARGFAKIIIPAKSKRLLLRELLGMGIDRRNLFPGLDGVGADIAMRFEVGPMPD